MRSTCIFIELSSYIKNALSIYQSTAFIYSWEGKRSKETSQSVRRLGILFTAAHLLKWSGQKQKIHTIGPNKYHRQTKTLY